MRSRTTPEFWECYAALPADVRRLAVKAYRLWRESHRHPGLHFKRVHSAEPIWSIRVGVHYRALGLMDGEMVTWFWIGSHADYDRLLG